MEDDFALRYVPIYPGENSRAGLVTLAPGLRSEGRFAPLARGLKRDALSAINILGFFDLRSIVTEPVYK